jgi:hypothetical protein
LRDTPAAAAISPIGRSGSRSRSASAASAGGTAGFGLGSHFCVGSRFGLGRSSFGHGCADRSVGIDAASGAGGPAGARSELCERYQRAAHLGHIAPDPSRGIRQPPRSQWLIVAAVPHSQHSNFMAASKG